MFYNPTDDYDVKVNYMPTRINKKTNPNDANMVDSNDTIRKFKYLVIN